MMDDDPYKTLGVPRDATATEIKRSYRTAAQRMHPDRGGSKDEFQALTAAYKLLTNAARRARFDKTGDAADTPDIQQEARHKVVQLILACLDAEDVDEAKDDIIALLRNRVHKAEFTDMNTIVKLRAGIAKRERALKRLRKKTSGENFLSHAIAADIAQRQQQIVLGEEALAFHKEIYKVLDQFAYDVDLAMGILGNLQGIQLGR